MFREVVRAHRQRLGLTQEELADKTGISVRSIGKIEAGRISCPRPSTVRLLADAFGLDGPERDRFQQSASGEPTITNEGRPVPAQLPLDVRGFSGRHDELEQLDVIVESVGRQPTAVVVSALSGTVGVGKTALAVHWAHRVADRFPDGQLYVNLRGFDPEDRGVEPSDALRGFLDALGVAPQGIPVALPDRAALYRSLLGRRRMLVLLDNARDVEQVRPLLPGSPGSVVVVTSRNRLSGLVAAEGAHPVVLDLLTPQAAYDLLAERIGRERMAAEGHAADWIIARCAGLPLALAIVAAHAASRPGFSLATLAHQLADTREALDALANDDSAMDIRAAFSWSYRALSPDAARLFRLLGLAFGPEIAGPAVASLAGAPAATVRPTLAELTRANLLIEHTPDRFTFHDLLRAYAMELGNETDSVEDHRGAQRRLLDHYLHSANAAAGLLRSRYEQWIALDPPVPGVAPESPTDPAGAVRWLDVEMRTLLAALQRASDDELDGQCWRLAWVIEEFLDCQGRWPELRHSQGLALAAARRAGDRAGLARVHQGLARVLFRVGDYDEAAAHLVAAVDICRELGDQRGEANAYARLGYVNSRRGNSRRGDPLAQVETAVRLFRASDDRLGLANALNGAAWLHILAGRPHQAVHYCQEALQLYRSLPDPSPKGHIWDTLGFAHHHLGNHDEAVACYQRALALFRAVGNVVFEARASVKLGDTHDAAGRRDAAIAAWQAALDVMEKFNHPNTTEVRAKVAAARAGAPTGSGVDG